MSLSSNMLPHISLADGTVYICSTHPCNVFYVYASRSSFSQSHKEEKGNLFLKKLEQISEVHMFRHASSETKWQQTRGGGRIFAHVPDKGLLTFII